MDQQTEPQDSLIGRMFNHRVSGGAIFDGIKNIVEERLKRRKIVCPQCGAQLFPHEDLITIYGTES